MEIPKEIEKMVSICKERTDYFILSQPERITPLQQYEAISKAIDFLVENIMHHMKEKT